MAPDKNNPGGWKVPSGFTLTRHEGYYVDHRGMERSGSTTNTTMEDGQIEVPHFVEAEPFVWEANTGRGQYASPEAKQRALAGDPIWGWNPNCILLPIENGWMPPQYTLRHDDDPTPVTEPASVAIRELTPDEEVAKLKAAIEATQARIDEIEGGAA